MLLSPKSPGLDRLTNGGQRTENNIFFFKNRQINIKYLYQEGNLALTELTSFIVNLVNDVWQQCSTQYEQQNGIKHKGVTFAPRM